MTEHAIVKYKKNPFQKEIIELLDEKIKSKRKFVHGNTASTVSLVDYDGMIVGETALLKYNKVDSTKFAKIYIDKIKYMFGMTRAAMNIFEYILINLPKNIDKVYLYEVAVIEHTGLSRSSYFNGMKWLIHNKFIAKSVELSWYFINPTIFFNGDRISLIDIYEKENIAELRENIELTNTMNITVSDEQRVD